MTDSEITSFIAQRGHKLDLYSMNALLNLADWYHVVQLSGDCYEEGHISILIYTDGDMSKDMWRRYVYDITNGSYVRWVQP